MQQKAIKVHVTRNGRTPFFLMYFDDPTTGKRQQRSTKVKDDGTKKALKAAEDAAAVWGAELRDGRYKPASQVTWNEFRDRFLESREKKAAGTLKMYGTAFEAFARHATPKRLADVSQATLERVADGWRSDGLSPTTVIGYMRHVMAALAWAKKKKLIAEAIDPPELESPGEPAKGRPITREEFDRMLSKVVAGIVLAGQRKKQRETARKVGSEARAAYDAQRLQRAREVAPMFTRLLWGAWLSGMRLAELVDLSWTDPKRHRVDFSARRPTIRFGAHQKKRKASNVPMTPDFAEFLRQTPESERRGSVFPMPTTDLARISNVVSMIGEAAGVVVSRSALRDGSESIKFASLHDLRRSFGTRWSVRVMPAVLRQLMRHADIQTTMAYYINHDADELGDVIWEAGAKAAADSAKDSGIGSFVGSEPDSGELDAPADEGRKMESLAESGLSATSQKFGN